MRAIQHACRQPLPFVSIYAIVKRHAQSSKTAANHALFQYSIDTEAATQELKLYSFIK